MMSAREALYVIFGCQFDLFLHCDLIHGWKRASNMKSRFIHPHNSLAVSHKVCKRIYEMTRRIRHFDNSILNQKQLLASR